MRRGREWAVTRAWVVAGLAVLVARPVAACVADCNGDGKVTVDELVVSTRIELGAESLSACEALDNNFDGRAVIDELVMGISRALNGCGGGPAGERLMYSQNEELDVFELDSGKLGVLVPPATGFINGEVCLVPSGHGNFVVADDYGAPADRVGWAVYTADGTFLKKLPLPARPDEEEAPDPIGCAFDGAGRLFTTAIGDQAVANGQLSVFFPPTYDESCILDTTINTPGNITIDSQGNVYVPGVGGVRRYLPPFPTSVAECETVRGQKENFIDNHVPAGLGIVQSASGSWYVSVVALRPTIAEFTADGTYLRDLFPPRTGGSPSGLALDSEGSVYYADLGLSDDPIPHPVDGKGSVRKITFDGDGNPSTPETLARGLSFPDGLGILPVRPPEWTQLGGSLRRTNFDPDERAIAPETVQKLIPKWRYYTGAIVTGAPAVAWVNLPGEGQTQVVFASSWDGNFYALRADNGSRVWFFTMKAQPGASYPFASSPVVEWLNDRQVVYVAGGMTMYCIDAATGAEIWEFDAGTGCTTCGFDPLDPLHRERNEVESSPAVFDGLVYFGMDLDDGGGGKGGMFAVRADDGRLAWFFDLATQSTCRPFPGDNIRHFDGYHTAGQLPGLPEDFLATRPGCNFDRTGNECGNIWSSAAIDGRRRLLYIGTDNCDTDTNPNTPRPNPPMPPFDDALMVLTLDGEPAWRWRPRDVDNFDFGFGSVPNLFEAVVDGRMIEVVGIGSKDGTYILLDRDGVNEINHVAWNDPDPSGLPYWSTRVVDGGPEGGIIGSAAIVEGTVFFSTAIGVSLSDPQRPAAWALSAGDGHVVWSNPDLDPSFGPTLAIPGLVFRGELGTGGGELEVLRSSSGELWQELNTLGQPGGVASAPAIAGGVLFTGGGTGVRGGMRDVVYAVSEFDTPVSAFCIEGTPGCEPACPDDGQACTFEFRRDGTCMSEAAPDTLSCCLQGGQQCTAAQKGTCHAGTCATP